MSIQTAAFSLGTEEKLNRAGVDPDRLMSGVCTRVDADVKAGIYPGASFAIARNGEVLATAHFGAARLATNDHPAQAASGETLWLLYSQTKPITSCAIWILIERGLLNVHKPVADYIPAFSRHGKEAVTVYHALTHQAGLPNARVSVEAWNDRELQREAVCDWHLEWEPGTKVFYHSGAAHWIQALLIEAVTGRDFRQFIMDEVVHALGLRNMHIGVPNNLRRRLVDSYLCNAEGNHEICPEFNTPEFIRSGLPSAGCFASAADVALFYQMLLGLGELNGKRLLSPRMVQWAVRNHTGERVDEFFGIPMHRALGVHVRGSSPQIRGLSSMASAETFGHGGVGTSYSWADPETKVSFTYLTNSRLPEPLHSQRLEEIMTMAHACVVQF